MKKLNSFVLLIITLISLAFASCSNTDDPIPSPTPNEEDTTYVVSLNLAGEYTDVTEEPLSRADTETPKKYYGINVYCMKTDGSEADYSNYAYGVFDNVADMKIILLGGYKYKFECTSLTNDTDRLRIEDDKLMHPFATSFSTYYGYRGFNISELNKIITSQNTNLRYIKEGRSSVEYISFDDDNEEYLSWDDLYYPRMNRFYGELEDFEPANGSTATILMKRTAFGIKVVVNGVPDGSLSWQDDNREIMFNSAGCTGSEKLEFSQVYTFADVYNCWKSEDVFTKEITISFIWTRANGYKQYFNEAITVKRNVMTTITVNLKGGANDTLIGVSEDETPMENEEIYVEYDGGNLNDTPVNPEE